MFRRIQKADKPSQYVAPAYLSGSFSAHEMERRTAFRDVEELMAIEMRLHGFACVMTASCPGEGEQVRRIIKQVTDAIQELKDMRLDALRVALDKHKGEGDGNQ